MSPRQEQHAAKMRLANVARRLLQIKRHTADGHRAGAIAQLWEQARADKRLARSKWPALELEKQRHQ